MITSFLSIDQCDLSNASGQGAIDVGFDAIADVKGLFRDQAMLCQGRVKNCRIRFFGANPRRDVDCVEILFQPHIRQKVFKPRIEIRNNRQPPAACPQRFERRHDIVENKPCFPRGEEGIGFGKKIVEGRKGILGEDFKRRRPPPVVFQSPQFAFRRAGRKGHGRLILKGLHKPGLDQHRGHFESILIRNPAIDLTNAAAHFYERSGGIKEDNFVSFRNRHIQRFGNSRAIS